MKCLKYLALQACVFLLAVPAFGVPIDLSGVAQEVVKRQGLDAYDPHCVATFVDSSRHDSAPAYAVGNAHCYSFIEPKNTRYKIPADMTLEFTAVKQRVKIVELTYGSTKGTDLGVFRLNKTIGEMKRAGVRPMPMSSVPARAGEA